MPVRPRINRPFRFGLATLGAVIFAVCVILALWRWSPPIFWPTLLRTVLANGIGVVLALFVTYVLRLPNDGTLRCESGTAPPDAEPAPSATWTSQYPR